MNIKASFLSAGLLALGMFASSEAGATNYHLKMKKRPTPTRAAPELNARHAAMPAALLLAGVAVIAGRRRKSQ
jgi:hypothetical protein